MEKSFLDKLLEKPESYRKNVAMAATAILAILIFSAWLMLTSISLKQAAQTQEKESEAEKLKEQQLPSFKEEPSIKTRLMEQQEQTPGVPTTKAPSLIDQQQLVEQQNQLPAAPTSPETTTQTNPSLPTATYTTPSADANNSLPAPTTPTLSAPDPSNL